METVVLVHGLWTPGLEMRFLAHRLRAEGFEPRRFPYSSVDDDAETNAARLKRFLRQVPGETIHLVGHSLGGVLAVKTVQQTDPERLGRVVCLGAPLQGSTSARNLARLPGGNRLIGRSGSALVDKCITPWTASTELGLIAGRLPIGLGMLLGGLPRPHDGVVAVEETRLEGATAHIVLPVSHLAMIWSREVSRQVVRFLRDGRFAFQ